MSTVVVVAGGDPPHADQIRDLPDDSFVIAADSGLVAVRELGLVPALVIGDLDSVTSRELAWAEAAGARIDRRPADKDVTDLELALEAALGTDPGRLVVVGTGGGRTDHQIGNWAAIAAVDELVVEVRDSGGTTWVLRGQHELTGDVGETISLIPWGGPATVSTRGLRWNLSGETLSPFAARGVSNEVTDATVQIHVADGVLLLVRPRSP